MELRPAVMSSYGDHMLLEWQATIQQTLLVLHSNCIRNRICNPLAQNTSSPQRIEYKVISLTYNTLQSSQPSYLRQLFTIQPPRSTLSTSTLTLLRPSVTSSLKFSNRSIAVAVP